MTRGELYVVGTRTFAAEIAGYAEEVGFRVVGLLEPHDHKRVGQTIHGLPVTWLEETKPDGRTFIVGTGENDRHETVQRLIDSGWRAATLVHPRAHVAPNSKIGEGAVVAPGVVIGVCSEIGDHTIVSRGTLVGHHTHVGPFVTFGPGANIAGNVRIEESVFVGMAAVVRDHVTIGPAAVVAMGAIVVTDVAAGIQVRGVPARPHIPDR